MSDSLQLECGSGSRERWQLEDQYCVFHEIWNDFWGKQDWKAKLKANDSVTLPSSVNALGESDGKVLIREYDHELLVRIHQLQQEDRTCGGVAIIGQPGSGKTYSLYALLLHRLVDSKPVVFIPSSNRAYYFSEIGVVSASGSLLEPQLLRGIPQSTWCLINSDEANDSGPPAELTSTRHLFIIQATSPCSSRYQKWVEVCNGRIWCMKQWTRDELLLMLRLHPRVNPDISDGELSDQLDQAIRKWGWAPRDLSRVICRGLQANIAYFLNPALHGLTTASLLQIVAHGEIRAMNSNLSYQIISMYRSGNAAYTTDPQVHDRLVIDFKSEYIAARVQHRLGRLHLQEGLKFISYCRFYPGSALLAGWAFEDAVVGILCSADHPIDLPPLISASRIGTKFTMSASVSHIVTRTKPPRAVIHFDEETLNKVTGRDDVLYLPSQSNFPLLDGFYLRDLNSAVVTVVVLQITVSMTHKGSPAGYAFLKKLKDQLQSAHHPHGPHNAKKSKKTLGVSFEYHLVVPSPAGSSRPVREVAWVLPDDIPADIDGPGYVQAVPIDIALNPNEEDESHFRLGDN